MAVAALTPPAGRVGDDPLNEFYSGSEFRFTTNGDILYVIIMNWPGDKGANLKSLAESSPLLKGQKITDVSLLGHEGKLAWSQDEHMLNVKMPEKQPCDYAIVLKIKGAL